MMYRCLLYTSVLFRIIMAVHGLQYAAASALKRKMQVLADLAALGKGVNDLVRNILRVGGHKPNALQPVYLVHPTQQFCKGAVQLLSIGVDVLPQKGDFLCSLFHKLLGLRQNRIRGPAALSAPHIGHNALGLSLIHIEMCIRDSSSSRFVMVTAMGRP